MNLYDVLSSILRRLLDQHAPHEIGIVTLDRGPDSVRRALAERNLPVSDDSRLNAAAVITAAGIRGHERQVIIVTITSPDALRRNFGAAIDAYIAMSRAVKQLFVIELAA